MSRTKHYADDQYRVDTWEERDRLHVGLENETNGETVADWWDDDARSMFEDGFFDARRLEASVIEYATEIGLISKDKRIDATRERNRRAIESARYAGTGRPPFGTGRKSNPARRGVRNTPDDQAAKELLLYATNHADLYRQRIVPVLANLARKIKRGIYKRALAAKLWQYVADDAAQRYMKEFGEPSGINRHGSYGIFNKPTRELVAEWLITEYEEALEGEAVKLGVPVADVMKQMGGPSPHRHPFYQGNPAKRVWKQGDRIRHGEFVGSVVRPYSEGMVEIRLPGGLTVVPVGEITPLNADRSIKRNPAKRSRYYTIMLASPTKKLLTVCEHKAGKVSIRLYENCEPLWMGRAEATKLARKISRARGGYSTYRIAVVSTNARFGEIRKALGISEEDHARTLNPAARKGPFLIWIEWPQTRGFNADSGYLIRGADPNRDGLLASTGNPDHPKIWTGSEKQAINKAATINAHSAKRATSSAGAPKATPLRAQGQEFPTDETHRCIRCRERFKYEPIEGPDGPSYCSEHCADEHEQAIENDRGELDE